MMDLGVVMRTYLGRCVYLAGFGETQDIAIGILDIEIARGPGPLVERFCDGGSATDELRVQIPDSSDGQVRVEMVSRPAVGALRFKLRRALQVDDCAIAGYAGVEVFVDKVA